MKAGRWLGLAAFLLWAGPDCNGCFAGGGGHVDCSPNECDEGSDDPARSCTDGKACIGGRCECLDDCTGRECGYDACGDPCGDCWEPQEDCVDGRCVCVPHCEPGACGDDGCGGECPADDEDVACDDDPPCAPDCEPGRCGDADGCGGVCGCGPHGICEDGECRCTPDCSGRDCGDDGCGGRCGECVGGLPCWPDDARPSSPAEPRACVDDTDCDPDEICAKDDPGYLTGMCVAGCRPDSCRPGWICDEEVRACVRPACVDGRCGDGGRCVSGRCVQHEDPGTCCQPLCDVRECGDDGCGGTCGDCLDGEPCIGGTCVDLDGDPHCRPCEEVTDCPQVAFVCAALAEPGRRFCFSTCNAADACPPGYECDREHCVPADGLCSCDPGQTETCRRSGPSGGVCEGLRTCEPGRGWVCDAPDPQAGGCGVGGTPDASARDGGASDAGPRGVAPPDADMRDVGPTDDGASDAASDP
jgi:hypothetical protein